MVLQKSLSEELIQLLKWMNFLLMLKLPRAIAQKAKNGNTGARELSNVVNYMFDKILYDVMSKPKNTYKKCILLKGIEEENTRYKLE